MSIPKNQKEYFELSHEERKRVPSSVLIEFLSENTTGADDNDKDLYYPLSEAFDKMSEAERAEMSHEDKLNILNETPQKRNK